MILKNQRKHLKYKFLKQKIFGLFWLCNEAFGMIYQK